MFARETGKMFSTKSLPEWSFKPHQAGFNNHRHSIVTGIVGFLSNLVKRCFSCKSGWTFSSWSAGSDATFLLFYTQENPRGGGSATQPALKLNQAKNAVWVSEYMLLALKWAGEKLMTVQAKPSDCRITHGEVSQPEDTKHLESFLLYECILPYLSRDSSHIGS